MAKQLVEAESELRSPGMIILLRQLATYAVCGVAAAIFWFAAGYLKAAHAGFWVMMGAALLYGMAILAIVYVANRLQAKSGDCASSPAVRRYQRRLMTAASAYVLLLICAIGAYIRAHPTGVLAYVLAIAPALGVVACIVIMGLYLREETDEFQRAIQTESALWATGGLLTLATVWGFLEMFHLAPHIESWWAVPIWCALLGPAQVIARRRYR